MGWAEIVTDTNMSTLGIGLKDLKTPIPATSFNFNWIGNDGGACLLFGEIQHNNPTNCPDIINCNDGEFKLKPEINQMFNGFGLGAQASLSLMDGKEVYSIADTVKFKEIIKGALGVTYYGLNESQKEIKLVAKVDLQLPKIDSRFVPSDWREGKPLGTACISLDYFTITEVVEGWFTDETVSLGRHLGLYAKFGLNEENVLFIPFTDLKDNEDESIFFFCPNFHEEFTIGTTKRSLPAIVEMIHQTFTVEENLSRIIVDLSSSDNSIILKLPDGTTITEKSSNSEFRTIKVSDRKYTVFYIYQPPSGIYHLSYRHTGNERAALFGSNNPPQATIHLNGNIIEWSLEDNEQSPIDYRLALVDDYEHPVIHLQQGHISKTNQGKTKLYEIESITHIKTGDYRAAIYYTDNLNPQEFKLSSQTIHLEKSISTPANLTALTTNDFVYLSWDSASGANSYTVSIISNDNMIYRFKTLSNHIKISDLLDGTYQATVMGYDEDGLSGDQTMVELNVNHSVSNIIPQAVETIQTSII